MLSHGADAPIGCMSQCVGSPGQKSKDILPGVPTMQAHAGKDLLSTVAGSIMLLTALVPAPAMAAMPSYEVRHLPVQPTPCRTGTWSTTQLCTLHVLHTAFSLSYADHSHYLPLHAAALVHNACGCHAGCCC